MMAFTDHATGQVLIRNADFVKCVLKLRSKFDETKTDDGLRHRHIEFIR
jgi:hypothetical protein